MNKMYLRIAAATAIVTLCACSGDSQEQNQDTKEGGGTSNSSLTFYSMTPSDSEPVVSPLEVTAVTCDVDSDTR
ncbi:MAG: hypothetical protein ABR578_01205, partial [Chromatocurvus sp.]